MQHWTRGKELQGEPIVERGYLRSGIHQEIEWTGAVYTNLRHNECSLNLAKRYTDDVSGAVL
jgi:hypothetical protein